MPRSRAAIDQHVRAGDRVAVILLPGARVRAAGLGAGAPPGRGPVLPELLDLIFESDQVITW